MTEPTDVQELREKIERADQMVTNLCKPRYTPNAREWTMSIPARPDHDPDLVIGAGLDAGRAALERLEELEDALERVCRNDIGASFDQRYVEERVRDFASWERGFSDALSIVQRIAGRALATPAPAPQQGGEDD